MRPAKAQEKCNVARPAKTLGTHGAGSRVQCCKIAIDLKNSNLLPYNAHFTELIIRRFHTMSGHYDIGQTWAGIQQKFWIVEGRLAVCRSIGNCVTCKKCNVPVKRKAMADFPLARLEFDEPSFSHIKVD